MVKRICTVAAIGAIFSSQALAFSFGPAGSGPLQSVLDGITVGGPSSIDVSTDELSELADSNWQKGVDG